MSTPVTNLNKTMEMIERKLHTDYYVMPVRDSGVDRLEFECYNAQNATSKDIEEIKQMVLNQFKNE